MYLVLALGWVIYVLILAPIISHNQTIGYFYTRHMICTENLSVGSPTYQEEKEKCDDGLKVALAVVGNDPWREARAVPFILLFQEFLPPFVLYAVGGAIIWFDYRGFRKSTPP
jgi:hypothetical protein